MIIVFHHITFNYTLQDFYYTAFRVIYIFVRVAEFLERDCLDRRYQMPRTQIPSSRIPMS